MKTCNICNQTKTNHEFAKDKNNKDYLRDWCRACGRTRPRKPYLKVPQHVLDATKQKKLLIFTIIGNESSSHLGVSHVTQKRLENYTPTKQNFGYYKTMHITADSMALRYWK